MLKIICIIGIFIFSNLMSYAEEKISFYQDKNRFNIVLPEGYCDITESIEGKFTKNYLENGFKNVGTPLIPKIIYRPCNHKNKAGHPWGYTAVFSSKLPNSLTKEEFFNLSSEGFEDSKITSDIINDVNKSHEMSDLGIDLKSMGNVKKIWQDENILIYYSTLNSTVNNIEINEVITSSIFIYKKYPIYNYIYEVYGEDDGLKSSQLLLESSKLTLGN